MSLNPCATLGVAWPPLVTIERVSIGGELSQIAARLWRVKHGTSRPFISMWTSSLICTKSGTCLNLICLGSVSDGHLQDRCFQFSDEGGSTPTVKSFHDLRYIHLTHGHLLLENIMISQPPGARDVKAIINGEQADWYMYLNTGSTASR